LKKITEVVPVFLWWFNNKLNANALSAAAKSNKMKEINSPKKSWAIKLRKINLKIKLNSNISRHNKNRRKLLLFVNIPNKLKENNKAE